jgi:hypothetical protein
MAPEIRIRVLLPRLLTTDKARTADFFLRCARFPVAASTQHAIDLW